MFNYIHKHAFDCQVNMLCLCWLITSCGDSSMKQDIEGNLRKLQLNFPPLPESKCKN